MRKSHKRIDRTKKRSTSSNNWLDRHVNDIYVQKSKLDNYRSRAAYKLLEMDERFRMFGGIAPRILDLGCAPGSWIQVIKSKSKTAQITGIDLLETDDIEGVEVVQMDIMTDSALTILGKKQFDIVLSDISPNTTGVRSIDHLRIMAVCERVFEIAKLTLARSGIMVFKVFQGGTENQLLSQIKSLFKRTLHFKPQASRKESSEIYLVALGFSGPRSQRPDIKSVKSRDSIKSFIKPPKTQEIPEEHANKEYRQKCSDDILES